jgi:NACHT domain
MMEGVPSGSLPGVDFSRVRPYGKPASREGGFEELASVLMERGVVEWPQDVRFERPGNPDGGRDGRGVLPGGDVWAWQAKFLGRFDADAVKQVTKSVRRALTCEPGLRRYFVVFPIDLPAGDAGTAGRTSARHRWKDASEKWAAEARASGMDVEFIFVGAHELLTALTLSGHGELIRYWFGQDAVGHGEALVVYLGRLVEALDADPWPTRLSGPVLAPSQIERKLLVSGDDGPGREDADDLCMRCSRLVILGDSGAGKTWLARRAARRCAEAALDRLQSGIPVDEVELPVFTTCARLAIAEGISIRDMIVRSALGQLPDLGGSLADEVRALLVERDGPTLVVLDSLDEAAGRDGQVRLADTLLGWRVILTSRPSSWDGQLAVTGGDPSRLVGTLLPLSYPGDVEPFIASWFRDRPEWGADLAAQIRRRQELQEAATIPLVLAFYCIIGGQVPLPARTPELYDKVVSRMLTGRWRGSSQPPPEGVKREACLAILRSWAWQAAKNDPVSGVGRWLDEIAPEADPDPVLREALDDPVVRAAVDHVAVPLGPPDPDTGRTTRRFAHRSIQEHLVAGHVASMLARQAAQKLAGHLWYDEDWAPYALPAAIAMHPDREQVLGLIARRVTGSSELPGEILALDGRHQVSAVLARLAVHTDEADWPAGAAALITQAMRRLHGEESFTWIPSGWPSFSEPLVQAAARILDAEPPQAGGLHQIAAGAVLGLVGRERVLAAVLRALALTSPQDAIGLASLVPRLSPSAAERAQARAQVKQALGEACCRHFPRRPSQPRLGSESMRLSDPDDSPAYVLAELAVSGEERALAADELVALLGRCPEMPAEGFSAAIGSLDPSAAQREAAGSILLARLPAELRWDVVSMPGAIAALCQAPAQRAAALHALTESLVSTDAHVTDSAEMIAEITELITDLAGDDHDLGRARAVLAAEASREAASGNPGKASTLACLAAKLRPADGELALLEEALLAAIAARAGTESALQLADAGLAIAQAPAQQELFRRRALEAAVARCAGSQRSNRYWQDLFGDLLYFAETPGERARCLDLILEVLAREDIDDVVPSREFLTSVTHTADDLERLRAALLARLDDASRLLTVIQIAWALQTPALESETRERVRAALVSRLDNADEMGRLAGMAWGLIDDLSTTEAEKAEARRMLLKISCQTGRGFHWEDSLTKDGLRSLTADIDALQIQPCYLTDGMLTAIRSTTPLDAWLTALPRLSAPQKPAPRARGNQGPLPGAGHACPLGLERPAPGSGLPQTISAANT